MSYRGAATIMCLPYAVSDEHWLLLLCRSSDPIELDRLRALVRAILRCFDVAEALVESKYVVTRLEASSLRGAPTGLSPGDG